MRHPITVTLSDKTGPLEGFGGYDMSGNDVRITGTFHTHKVVVGNRYRLAVTDAAGDLCVLYITPDEDFYRMLVDFLTPHYEEFPGPGCRINKLLFREMTNAEILASGLLKQEVPE